MKNENNTIFPTRKIFELSYWQHSHTVTSRKRRCHVVKGTGVSSKEQTNRDKGTIRAHLENNSKWSATPENYHHVLWVKNPRKTNSNEQETRVSVFRRKRKTTPYLPQQEDIRTVNMTSSHIKTSPPGAFVWVKGESRPLPMVYQAIAVAWKLTMKTKFKE